MKCPYTQEECPDHQCSHWCLDPLFDDPEFHPLEEPCQLREHRVQLASSHEDKG
jgi:hypothetical protein